LIETSQASSIVVADASCLIVLTKIDSLDLLRRLYRDIRTTPEVADEYRETLPDWIEIDQPTLDSNILLDSKLGSGERSAILLALQRTPSIIILDDFRARIAAIEKGLDVIGTLGVLLEAKRTGLIPSVQASLQAILRTNFRVSEEIIQRFLRDADENYQ
jgi:predicted nucleic acid-binding protein